MKRYVANVISNNSLWAIAFLVIRSGINVILTPYITKKVGIEAFGYVALANSFVLYIDVICVAFNYFAGRNISVSYHSGKTNAANEYYSTILASDLLLFLVFGGGSAFVISFVEKIINISSALIIDVKTLFMLVLFKYFLTMIGTTLEVSEFIKNRLDICNKNKIISYLIYTIFVYLFFTCFEGRVYFVGIALLIQSCVYLVLQFFTKRLLVSDLRFSLGLFNSSYVQLFISKGIWISFNNLGNILNDGLDLLITNLMISESMVGMISIAKMIGNLCYSVVGAISNSLTPKQLKDYSTGNINGLITKLHKSMALNGAVFCVLICLLIGCGRDFFYLWMNSQNDYELYLLTILATSCFIIPSVVKPLYYVYVLVQNVKFASYITILMGVINTLSMYLLIKYTSLGGYAVLLTTAVLNLIHLIDTPLYAAYCLKQDWRVFYKPIIRHIVLCVITGLWGIIIVKMTPVASTWWLLVGKAFLCIICPFLIIIMFLNLNNLLDRT